MTPQVGPSRVRSTWMWLTPTGSSLFQATKKEKKAVNSPSGPLHFSPQQCTWPRSHRRPAPASGSDTGAVHSSYLGCDPVGPPESQGPPAEERTGRMRLDNMSGRGARQPYQKRLILLSPRARGLPFPLDYILDQVDALQRVDRACVWVQMVHGGGQGAPPSSGLWCPGH